MILNPFTTIPSIPLNACLIVTRGYEWMHPSAAPDSLGAPVQSPKVDVPGKPFKFYGFGFEINSDSICIKEDPQRNEWLENMGGNGRYG